MTQIILVALRTTLVTLVLTGLAYPLAITGLAQLLFPYRANGSIVSDEHGNPVGSELIGQPSRTRPTSSRGPLRRAPTATTPRASSGSNLGATSAEAASDRVDGRRRPSARGEPGRAGTASRRSGDGVGSGLDPHLSPEAARWQVPRVATRPRTSIRRAWRACSTRSSKAATSGFFGEPRVNVLT